MNGIPVHFSILDQLVEAIYSEPRAGRPMPLRIELGPDLFTKFQAGHREAMAAVVPEAVNVYPGSLAGVPVVEVPVGGAALVLFNGTRTPVPLE